MKILVIIAWSLVVIYSSIFFLVPYFSLQEAKSSKKWGQALHAFLAVAIWPFGLLTALTSFQQLRDFWRTARLKTPNKKGILLIVLAPVLIAIALWGAAEGGGGDAGEARLNAALIGLIINIIVFVWAMLTYVWM